MDAFYDKTVPNTFGWYLALVTAAEASKWTCASTSNCTVNDDVINKQWGNSDITQTPIYTLTTVTDVYTPVSYSMCAWGTTYATPDCVNPPEVSAY